MPKPKIEKGQHTVNINLRLSERMKKNIEGLAEKWDVPTAEAIRQLIESSPFYVKPDRKGFLANKSK